MGALKMLAMPSESEDNQENLPEKSICTMSIKPKGNPWLNEKCPVAGTSLESEDRTSIFVL
jgi:hypothetical protein